MTKLQHDVYDLHRKVHGDKHITRLLQQAVEECAELIVAISHYARGRKTHCDVAEEYADVVICLDAIVDELSKRHNGADVAKYTRHMMTQKLKRLRRDLGLMLADEKRKR